VDASVIAAGLVALAAALPWLAVLPLHGAAAVIAEALVMIAACHGAGLAIARLAALCDPHAPRRAVQAAPAQTTGRAALPPATPATPPAAQPAAMILPWGLAALIGSSGKRRTRWRRSSSSATRTARCCS